MGKNKSTKPASSSNNNFISQLDRKSFAPMEILMFIFAIFFFLGLPSFGSFENLIIPSKYLYGNILRGMPFLCIGFVLHQYNKQSMVLGTNKYIFPLRKRKLTVLFSSIWLIAFTLINLDGIKYDTLYLQGALTKPSTSAVILATGLYFALNGFVAREYSSPRSRFSK